MLTVGFKQSENDACLYILKKDNFFVIAVIHVDDFAIFHNNQPLCDETFKTLNAHFTLKKGGLKYFLGMRVLRDSIDHTLSLDQEEYATSILKRFDMYDCKQVVCPEEQMKLSKSQCPSNPQEELEMRDIPYAELV